jgi:hypothetical protein
LASIIQVVGRLRAVADAEQERHDRQLLQIRLIPDDAIGQSEERRQRGVDTRQELR